MNPSISIDSPLSGRSPKNLIDSTNVRIENETTRIRLLQWTQLCNIMLTYKGGPGSTIFVLARASVDDAGANRTIPDKIHWVLT